MRNALKSESSFIFHRHTHAIWIETNHKLNGFFISLIVCCVCFIVRGNIIQVDQTNELAGRTCYFINRTDENRCIVMIDVIESERWIAT